MTRILALDLGEKRIGVAVCDPTQTVVRPLATVVRASKREDADVIGRLVEENSISTIVVGLPFSLDGSEGPQARSTRRYAEFLSDALSIEIDFWDERYSTVAAEEILRTGPKRRKQRRAEIDSVAAAVILQAYLDAKDR